MKRLWNQSSETVSPAEEIKKTPTIKKRDECPVYDTKTASDGKVPVLYIWEE